MLLFRKTKKPRHPSALSLRELLRIQSKIERETGIRSLHDVRVTRDVYIYHGVWQASSHDEIDRDVFVKIFFANDENNKALFDRESWLYSNFHHDHLVRKEFSRTLNLGHRARHARMIVLEYIDGIDAAKLIDTLSLTGESLETPIALEIAIKILRALHEVHCFQNQEGQKLSIVHADITPHNILLSRKGQVKLIDFGAARVTPDPFEVPQARAGKPGYMAPEQVLTDHFDHRADLYALGVVISELILAKRLCSIKDLEHLRAHELHQSYKAQITASTIEQKLQEILLKAIDENPDHRFASAKDFMQSLENYLQVKNMILRADGIAEIVTGVMNYGAAQETRQNADLVASTIKEESKAETPPVKTKFKIRCAVAKLMRGLPYFLGIAFALVLLFIVKMNLPELGFQLDRNDTAAADMPDKINPEGGPRAAMQSIFETVVKPDDTAANSISLGSGALFVGASPWAEVSIAGYATQRPIPFSIKLPEGEHLVMARYQDDLGKWRYLSKTVRISAGATVRCLAYFEGGTRMVCR